MNTHNGIDYIAESIESVYVQDYKYIELIIIDNYSKYDLSGLFSQCKINYRYYRTESKLSLGEARNLGLSKIHGDYFCFLDDDDLWMPNKISLQASILDSFDDVGLVYSDVLYFNKDFSKKLYSFKKIYEGRAFINLIFDYNLCLSSVMLRRKIMLDYDMKFNARYELIEDADFFLNYAYYSEIACVKQVTTKYRIHSQMNSKKNPLNFFIELDAMYSDFFNRHMINENDFFTLLKKNSLNFAVQLWKNKLPFDAITKLKRSRVGFITASIYIVLFLIPYKVVNFLYRSITRRPEIN